MSMEMYAFIPSARIPTRDEWQHALDTLDMGRVTPALYPALDVARAKGFCPMMLAGVATGVEVDINSPPIDDFAMMVKDIPALAGKVTPEHVAISFRFGSRLSEAVCAQAACAALVSGFGAVVYDDLTGEVYTSPERLIAGARVNFLVVEYGPDRPKTPEFVAQLEQINGGPLPLITVTVVPRGRLSWDGTKFVREEPEPGRKLGMTDNKRPQDRSRGLACSARA